MNTETVLNTSIATVTFLLAAFGNFLLNIAPPGDNNSRLAVGISSFVMLFILLFINALTKGQPRIKMRRAWLLVSVICFFAFLLTSYFYIDNLGKLTFQFPPGQQTSFIAGIQMTPEAEQYKKENPMKTTSEIVCAFEGIKFVTRVWTVESIQRAKLMLTVNYTLVILFVALMLFSLTEGILVSSKKTKDSSQK
jgi:hypothetical protein